MAKVRHKANQIGNFDELNNNMQNEEKQKIYSTEKK